jgi:hypothetical protein
MKRLSIYFSTIIFGLLFISCSSLDEDVEFSYPEIEENSLSDSAIIEEELPIIIPEDSVEEENITAEIKNIPIPFCEEGEFEQLYSKDRIIKISESPKIRVLHNQDNEKKICILSGEAEITRGTE